MKLYLAEDADTGLFQPFTLTRPVAQLLFGCETLAERAARVFGREIDALLVGPELEGFEEAGAPKVAGTEKIDGPALVLASRFVFEPVSEGGLPEPPTLEEPVGAVDAPVPLSCDGELVGWSVPPGTSLHDSGEHRRFGTAAPGGSIEIPGLLLESPWHLMAANVDRIRADLSGAASVGVPETATVYGDHALVLADDVTIAPNVVFDVRDGPIRIDGGVTIEPLSVIRGPCYIGPGSSIFGGFVSDCSIGPVCKIRGEIDSSVVCGFSNKAHDGFIGHAVLGRWVNLGAMTTNSDLKNNYSTVRVDQGAGTIDTGERKIGVFLGDHVKTGIGTLLGTGTIVGAGSNVMAGPFPPRFVPPFSWGSGHDLVEYDVERFISTARTVMGRRGLELSASMEALLRRAHTTGRASAGSEDQP